MSLLTRIKAIVYPKAREQQAIDDGLELAEDFTIEAPQPKPKGKIIKATKRAEYSPVRRGKGGVIRVMPKQLQDIKEAQERPVEDN